MHKNFLYTIFLLMAFGTSFSLLSQGGLQQANDFLEQYSEKFGVNSNVKWRVIDDFTDNNGISHVRLLQTYQGIDVEAQMVGVHIKDGEVFYATGKFIAEIADLADTNEQVSTVNALQTALQNRALNTNRPLTPISVPSGANKTALFNLDDIALQDVKVNLLYAPTADAGIHLVWKVDIYEKGGNHWWNIQVDATTGDIINITDQVLHCDFGAPDPHEHIRRLNELEEMPCDEADELVKKGYISYSAYGAPSIVANGHDHTKHHQEAAVLTNTYRALPLTVESPNHGAFELLANPAANNTTASPNGWHNDGTNSYTITRGNNVWAQEDQNGNNGTGFSPDGGGSLDFDWAFDPNSNPTTGDNLNAAITNLFVWNNFMHDVFYNYGFTEVNANFQEDNFGRGGSGGDFVFADAQDGSSTNNANFGTPADGGNPRMQMFLWDAATTTAFSVNSPSNIAGSYGAIAASFGDLDFSVSGNLVLAEDGSGNNEACNPLTNGAAITGNIALIDRGNCEFGVKVLAAQNAGAIAVVVCNNDPGAIISMGPGASGGSVTIPSIMISQGDCATIRAEIPTVNVNISSTPGTFQINGDFDNGIIAHEYGHGISNRMTSSAANCLGNAEQMGEGWSDWWGLVLTVQPSQNANTARGIGTYAEGQPINGGGIRPFPYSRDMGVNPVTYADVADATNFSQPHGIGSIWCSMIWDLYWDLIDVYGYDTDLYDGTSGNNIAMNLITQGCTYQGCNPGFEDGRDGILAADQALYGGANECIIWEAFARRGLGFSADQGSSNNRSDGTEAFDLPPSLVCNSFNIISTNSPVSVCQPSDAIFNFDVTFTGGFSDSVTLSATGLPAGLSASFSTNPITAAGSYTMTVSGTAGVSAGSYNFSIDGTDGGTITTSEAVTLEIQEAVSGVAVLSSPSDGAIDQSTSPNFVWSSATGATTYDVEIATDAGFSNIVISQTGLNSTSYSASGLAISTTYYWRIIGISSCGAGAWSNVFSFTTAAADPGTCDNPISLACGDSASGNTADGQNNYTAHNGGDPGATNWTGPELVYEITVPASDVTIAVTNLSVDLDMYLLGVCTDPLGSEIAFSENGNTDDETITTTLAAGTYYVMIDGWDGANGTFDISLTCALPPIVCGVENGFYENFEGGQPSGWIFNVAGTPNVNWQFDDQSIGVVTGSTLTPNPGLGNWAYYDDDAAGNGAGNNIATATTPTIDMSAYQNISLAFDYAFDDLESGGNETVTLSITDGSATYYWNGSAWTTTATSWLTGADASGNFSELIPPALDNSILSIALEYNDDNEWAWGFGFDNFGLCGDEVIIVCQSSTIIDDMPIMAGTYSYADSINSAGMIQSTDIVTFEAGQIIRLNPGFMAVNGSTFTARIQSCTPATQEEVIEERTEEITPVANEIKVFPNPFSDQTTIAINLTAESSVSIQLYDLTGKQVVNILQTNRQVIGTHQYLLDASHIETGIYILIINIDGKIQSKKLSVIR